MIVEIGKSNSHGHMTNSEHSKLHESLKGINEKRIKQAVLKGVISHG